MSAPPVKSAQRQRINKQCRDLGFMLTPVQRTVTALGIATPAEVVAALPQFRPRDVRLALRILADDGALSVLSDHQTVLYAPTSPEGGR